MTAELRRLLDWYETLSAASLPLIRELYSPATFFKDPFNEVRTPAAVQRIFEDMFERVGNPRFRFVDTVSEGRQAFVTWHFDFVSSGKDWRIHGASHLRFDSEGRIEYHRDYWDAAEELYEKLPVLGWILKRVKRLMEA